MVSRAGIEPATTALKGKSHSSSGFSLRYKSITPTFHHAPKSTRFRHFDERRDERHPPLLMSSKLHWPEVPRYGDI